ncbi:hypothetical protein [Pseudomonas sp. LD120]|uniref:hypothetical protein n=1 Tax=Pseudomonas sp. LD120 TaxID=485751 RepID=UPI00135A3B92|nr:hypothetical protein [Pseudomonas sp. LD120]KAF0865911.1 hypothetical protein PLD_11750 [Pseudomonas sp. LD120]
MRNRLKLTFFAGALFLLSGCESHEDHLKSLMRCGIAASDIGKGEWAVRTGSSAKNYIEKNGLDDTYKAKYLSYSKDIREEFSAMEAELGHYKAQDEKMRIANSSSCQSDAFSSR